MSEYDKWREQFIGEMRRLIDSRRAFSDDPSRFDTALQLIADVERWHPPAEQCPTCEGWGQIVSPCQRSSAECPTCHGA